ncbi:MAG: hypothetical protein HOP15_05775 [Planctomycetes bacterium]|nr:hypothetical protein [Planctomycetota bacterium]
MGERWIYAALALATAHWWWAALAVLLRDLRAAGKQFESPHALAPARAQRGHSAPIEVESRTPLNRVLAFRGVARRVAARQRWEGGFGRRGL